MRIKLKDTYLPVKRIKLTIVILILSIINYVGFMTFCLYIDGSALKGTQNEDGFFVSHNGEEFKEVDSWIWHLNRIEGYSLLATQPVGVLAFGYLAIILSTSFLYKEYKNKYKELRIQVLTVTDTLWEGRLSGRFGLSRHKVWFMDIKLYNEGLTFKPLFMPRLYLPLKLITSVKAQKGKLKDRLIIEHNGYIYPSPIVLSGNKIIDFTAELQKIPGMN